MQRVLAAGAAAAALTGAVLLRTWDRKAGRRVAELSRARVRDEWRTEERIAELETDIEESREIRVALDTKLRAKRAELARLRSEHAELLRRYATAETERASALEGRRLLAIEAAAPTRALPAVAAGPARRVPATTPDRPATNRPATNHPTPDRPVADRPAPTAALYAQADRALLQLARNAARQQRAAQSGQDGENGRGNSRADAAERTGGARHARTATAAGPALRPVPATAAAVAPHRPTASRELGGFDFFGNATSPGPRQLTAPLEDDLADVVGDEAVAEQSARAEARSARAEARTQARAALTAGNGAEAGGEQAEAPVADGATTAGAGEVIDLTAHDETEQLDLGALRTAIS